MSKAALVTVDAGYIGSYVTRTLLQVGDQMVVRNNLCNSSRAALQRVAHIAAYEPVFVNRDVRDVGRWPQTNSTGYQA